MATDEERLVVTLEARVRDFERNFERAQKTSDKRLKAIEDRATVSAARLKSAFASIGSGVGSAVGAIGATAGISGLGLAGLFAGAKTAAADIAQIAAEAQKAGVAVEAFQELGYGAKQALVGIDALTDGLKEMQLRADEFIVTGAGGGAEACQRLGYTADELKVKLADPAALFEEIIEKLGRLDKAAQIRLADELFGGTGGEQFVRLLDQGNGYIARMRQEARDTGNVLDAELVQRAIEIDREFAKLSATVGTQLKGALVGVVSLMRTFADLLRDTASQSAATLQWRIDNLKATIDAMRSSPWKFEFLGGQEGLDQRIAEMKELQAQLDNRPGTSITVNKPATGNLGDLSAVGRGADLAKAYDQIVLSVQARIDQMATEQQMLGLTTAESEKLRVKQALLAEVQRAGITLTAEQAAQLDELAARSGDAAAALEEAARSQEGLIASMDGLRDAAYDVLGGFSNDLRSGLSLTDALDNALNRVLDTLMEIGLQDAITGLFGKPGTTDGGVVGSLLSGLLGSLPGKASGGPISAGQPYIVGERGPEIVVPRASGFVIPNHQIGLAGQGSGSGLTAAGQQVPQIHQTFVNQAPQVSVEPGPMLPNGRGGFEQQIMIKQMVRGEMESAISDGYLDEAAGLRWGLRRHGLG